MTNKKFKPSGIGKAIAPIPANSTSGQNVVETKEKEQDASKLEGQLDELAAALLVMKSALQQIDEDSHRFQSANNGLTESLKKYEYIVDEAKKVVGQVTQITVTSHISQESQDSIGRLLTAYCNLIASERIKLVEEQQKGINSFVEQTKAQYDDFLTKLDKQLTAHNKKQKSILDRYVFWCNTKVLTWLLGFAVILSMVYNHGNNPDVFWESSIQVPLKMSFCEYLCNETAQIFH